MTAQPAGNGGDNPWTGGGTPRRSNAIWKPYRPGMGGQAISEALCHRGAPGPLKREYRHPDEGNTMDRRDEGWLVFAAIVLGVAGIVRIFDAIWPSVITGCFRRTSRARSDASAPSVWMPYYPIWSLTYVGIGALVIFALAVYGGEAEAGS